MRNFYYILFFLISIGSYAQLQTAHWYFGANAGLDFTSGNPVPDINGQIWSGEGIASISDEYGNLLFYTNGVTVYTRNHTIMPNGSELYGHKSSSQSVLIVPAPENGNIFYIFTTDAFESFLQPPFPGSQSKGLNYSIVDMSLGTDGEVTIKNVNLLPISSESVTAVAKEDCSGYWIIGHYFGKFYVYSLTASGIDATPVITAGGFNSIAPNIGYLKASHDGQRLAFTSHSEAESLRVYDFDNGSGIINNQTTLYQLPRQYYGVEFSPNNDVLYASTSKGLYQYDLTSNPISDSEVELAYEPNGLPVALQLGLDSKIYYAKALEFQANYGYLSVINNPDNLANPDYEVDALYLGGREHGNGLPNFVPYLYHIKTFINGIEPESEYCGEAELNFSYCHVNKDFVESAIIHWDFGDGNTSTDENPVHTYTTPGTYTVVLSVTIGGKTYTSETEITIHPLPNVQNAELPKCITAGQQAEFDLTESYPLINPNGEDVNYTFHLSEEEAENNENPQPLSYTTTTTTILWVRAENEWGCVTIVQLELIVNTIPELTVTTPVEICNGTTAILEVTTATTNTVNWYETETATTPIFTGNPFTTPPLNNTTTYYVEVVSEEGCKSERQEIIVEITDSIEPEFDLTAQYCLNSQPEVLPTESDNEITGTWSPATIDTGSVGTQTYTFTPDTEQCSEIFTIEIEITDIITAEFDIETTYCQGATPDELFTESDNGVLGTWSPEFIDTTTPGIQTYTFTPDDETCYDGIQIEVEILEIQTPEFDLPTVYCIGSIPEILNTTSDNGITGNWFPTTIDTTTAGIQTYTFTPDGLCGEEFILEIEITQEITPEFDFELYYCQNEPAFILPEDSDNGVHGSWFPTQIETDQIGEFTFIFTPDMDCAETIIKTITVSEIITPVFADLPQSYCVNAPAEQLPTTSDNGVQGTWFPTQIDTSIQGETVYTFTPNAGQCGEEYQMTVTVYPHPEMELEEDIVICEGDSYTYTAPDGFDYYVWKNQNGEIISETQEVIFTEEGIYTLTVLINEIPCPLSRDIQVSFSTTPVITEIKSTESTLTVYATGDGPFEYSLDNVFWQSNNTFHNLQPGIYFVYVRDKKGCGTAAKQGAIMGIPNFISPNGDGYNDTWKIRALEAFPNTRLQIFDRYGKMFVDRILNGDFEWNGKYNGEPLPGGSYWYILILETGEKISGHINLRNY